MPGTHENRLRWLIVAMVVALVAASSAWLGLRRASEAETQASAPAPPADGTPTVAAASEPSTDADEDGLPDAWERRYFGDLKAEPEGDADADGLTNRQEHDAGPAYDPTWPSRRDTANLARAQVLRPR